MVPRSSNAASRRAEREDGLSGFDMPINIGCFDRNQRLPLRKLRAVIGLLLLDYFFLTTFIE